MSSEHDLPHGRALASHVPMVSKISRSPRLIEPGTQGIILRPLSVIIRLHPLSLGHSRVRQPQDISVEGHSSMSPGIRVFIAQRRVRLRVLSVSITRPMVGPSGRRSSPMLPILGPLHGHHRQSISITPNSASQQKTSSLIQRALLLLLRLIQPIRLLELPLLYHQTAENFSNDQLEPVSRSPGILPSLPIPILQPIRLPSSTRSTPEERGHLSSPDSPIMGAISGIRFLFLPKISGRFVSVSSRVIR